MTSAGMLGAGVFGNLAGQVALVTGAGGEFGIGFAVARALVAMDCSVVVAATSDRIRDRARALGPSARGHVADLTDPGAVDALIAAVIGWHGRIDVVVNNAGMASTAAGTDAALPLEALTRGEWDDTLARNLTTAFLATRSRRIMDMTDGSTPKPMIRRCVSCVSCVSVSVVSEVRAEPRRAQFCRSRDAVFGERLGCGA